MALDTQVPQWLVSQEAWQREDASRSTQELIQNMFKARELNMEQQKLQLQQKQGLLGMQQQQQEIQLNHVKLDSIAHDQSTIPNWLQEHPTWESRQDAEWPSAMTPQGENQLAQIRMRDAESVQKKAATTAISAFANRVAALSKSDPTAGGQFAPYIGKANPPPDIIQALSVAEQAAQTRDQNAKEQAELDAQARGDVQKTTVGPKGVSTTYQPAPPGGKDTTPKTYDLGNGVKAVMVPGAKTLHILKPGDSGKGQLFTVGQASSLAKGGISSTNAATASSSQKLMDVLLGKANAQFNDSNTPTTPETTTPASTNSFKVGDFTVRTK